MPTYGRPSPLSVTMDVKCNNEAHISLASQWFLLAMRQGTKNLIEFILSFDMCKPGAATA